jgi:uncharacterized membrane protein
MQVFWELLAVFCTGLFTGAALYVHLVEHPARMACGPALAVTEFAPSYKRAAIMQASLAFLGFCSATSAWLTGASIWWLLGGIIIGSPIPVTIIMILPINRRLLDPALDKDSPQAVQLLTDWGKLHKIRAIISIIAFVIFLLLLHRG